MYCIKCGNKIKEEDNFCNNCGSIKESTPNNFNYNKKEDNDTFCVVFGIISIIMFWLPFISIPLAIIAIINGKKYCKNTTFKSNSMILSILGIILSILYSLIIIFFLISVVTYSDYKNDYKYYESENKYSDKLDLDIMGHKWLGRDSSILHLENNKTYSWYLNDKDYNKNFHSGTYNIYTGYDAINYIATNLKEYNLTEEEQLDFFKSGNYNINNYILIVLNCRYSNIDGTENNLTGTIPYYGFYYESPKQMSLVNMKSTNKAEFTLIEENNNYKSNIV